MSAVQINMFRLLDIAVSIPPSRRCEIYLLVCDDVLDRMCALAITSSQSGRTIIFTR